MLILPFRLGSGEVTLLLEQRAHMHRARLEGIWARLCLPCLFQLHSVHTALPSLTFGGPCTSLPGPTHPAQAQGLLQNSDMWLVGTLLQSYFSEPPPQLCQRNDPNKSNYVTQ